MTLLYLPPPERAAPASALPPHPQATPPPPTARRPSRTAADAAPAAPGETAPALAPSQKEQPPAIDWTAEQDRVAESQARARWTELSQHCRDAEALHIYPPECHRYVAPKPWEPEEKRFGMAGPLPYVRAGPCVVGLGFWGCAVGKAPPPDSHVFDGMRDPDRPNPISDNGSYQPPPRREPLH